MGCPDSRLLPDAQLLLYRIIHILRGTISRRLRPVDGVYTQRFNRSHTIDGPLFRGRFKSILIGADRYLLPLVSLST
jgi:hypothetical protein